MKPNEKEYESNYQKAIRLCNSLRIQTSEESTDLKNLKETILAIEQERVSYRADYLQALEKITSIKDRVRKSVYKMMGLDEED